LKLLQYTGAKVRQQTTNFLQGLRLHSHWNGYR